jgi:hypothetical protein
MSRRPLAPVLLLAAALGGCGDNVVNSRMYYVGPNYNRDEDKSCEELVKLIKAKDAQIKAIEARIATAEKDAGGSVVATMVHRPNLAPVQAERYRYREIAEEKRCAM